MPFTGFYTALWRCGRTRIPLPRGLHPWPLHSLRRCVQTVGVTMGKSGQSYSYAMDLEACLSRVHYHITGLREPKSWSILNRYLSQHLAFFFLATSIMEYNRASHRAIPYISRNLAHPSHPYLLSLPYLEAYIGHHPPSLSNRDPYSSLFSSLLVSSVSLPVPAASDTRLSPRDTSNC